MRILYLPSVVVDDESFVPAAEVLVGSDLCLEFLQQSLVCSLTFSVHRSTDIVQDAHDPRRILGNYQKEMGEMDKTL